MIFTKKKLFLNSLRVLYQDEDLSQLLDKERYDLITGISYADLGLDKSGFKLRHKNLANISLDGTLDDVLNKFTRTTRQEVQQTYNIPDLIFKIGDPETEKTYELYKKFEIAQGRKPWCRESFDGVINFSAYYKDELIASVPCYDLNPYLQVRAIFSKRLEGTLRSDSSLQGSRLSRAGQVDHALQKIVGKATRRLIYEICKYGKEMGHKFVSLGSVNYGTAQKSNVADFKMFFGPRIGDEYTYIYRSRRFAILEKFKLFFGL